MDLQHFFYLTGSIAFIVTTLSLIITVIVLVILADKAEYVLNRIKIIVDQGAQVGSEVRLFITDFAYRVRRWFHF